MALTASQIKKLAFHSDFPIDTIIDTMSGSFTATQRHGVGSPRRSTTSHSNIADEKVFTQLIYSTDGGDTWNDQDVIIPTVSVVPVFQTVEVVAYSTTSDIVILASNWTASDETIDYKVVTFEVNHGS